MAYKGSCHCGALSYEVEGTFDQVLECNCSHCSRKGYLLWFVPRAQLKLLGTTNSFTTYTFNKHVISHQFCPRCGCAPFGLGAGKDGAAMAAINVRCLEGVDLATVTRVPVDGRAY